MPRWQAFVSALRSDVSMDRLRSELFNAGAEWELALGDEAIASFAVQAVLSFETLPTRLRQAERPEMAILEEAAAARRDSAEGGSASPALPLAERALVGSLIRAISGDESLARLSVQQAAERFERGRGEPADLLSSFVGELLSQYARHVSAREMGAMTESRGPKGRETPGLSIAQSKQRVRSLAAEAESVGRRIQDGPASADAVRANWSALVSDAFARGRALPGSSA